MRHRCWSAVAVAAVCVGAAVPAAAGSTIYSNELSIVFHSKPSGDSFRGRVSSAKPACRRGRRVVVFRKRSGADDRIRSARSRLGGAWEVIPPHNRVGGGNYYAWMRTKQLGGGTACAAVRTSQVRVERH